MTTWIRHRTTRTSTRTIIIPCYYYYFFFIFNITLAFATHFSFISSSSHTLRSSSSTACANAYVRTTTTTTAADSRLFWSSGQDCNDDVVADNTRRRILTSSINPRSPISAAIIVVGFSTSMPCSFAANAAASTVTSSQEQKDKENLIRGYNRLQYLLDNWEKETTICKIGQEVSEIRFNNRNNGACRHPLTSFYLLHQNYHNYFEINYKTIRQPLAINVNAHPPKSWSISASNLPMIHYLKPMQP